MESWIIIILLGFGIIMFARLFNNSDTQPVHDKLISEMEDTFEHFAMEIEEENKQLLEHVLALKQENEGQNSKLLSRIEFLEKQFLEKTAETVGKKTSQTHALYVKRNNKPIVLKSERKAEQTETFEVEKEDIKVPQKTNKMEIKQRYQQLFELHDQGKSMEYISKKLSMNKGEVQLIIQLAKQEEQSSV